MATCPKCGARVTEAMSFCPNCGAALKAAPFVETAAPAPPQYERREKGEKNEKREKSEKGEKHEKQGGGYSGAIIAGIILIIVGVFFAIQELNLPGVSSAMLWAVFFIVIGVAVILAYLIGMSRSSRRSPPT